MSTQNVRVHCIIDKCFVSETIQRLVDDGQELHECLGAEIVECVRSQHQRLSS